MTSLSEKPDDLSQWRAYTPAAQGVCIGFNTDALRQALDKIREAKHEHARFLTLGKVISLPDDDGQSFDEFIYSACKHVDVIDGEVVRFVGLERLLVAAFPFL